LAEWARVLTPGGTLVIETPHRSAACLAAAQTNPPATALHWLFGLPWPGYAHRTLFDESDLRAVAEQAGLAQLEITRPDAPQPILRLCAIKPSDALTNLSTRLHTGFVAAGIINPLTAPPYLAHLETIGSRILSAVAALPQDGSEACLAAILGASARYDPRITLVALQVLIAHDLAPAAAVQPHIELARSLISQGLPARMAACLRQSQAPPGTQAVRLRRFADQVSLYLTARLHPQEAALRPVSDWFNSITITPADRQITFFCAETVAILARQETARGIRAFAHNNLAAAQQHLHAAASYDVDNPLPIWNLARLALAENRRLDALGHYAALIELLPEAADALQAEMDAATDRQPKSLAAFLEPVSQEALE
jgi:hypothetical protein